MPHHPHGPAQLPGADEVVLVVVALPEGYCHPLSIYYLQSIYKVSTQYLLPEGLAQLVQLLGVEQLRLGVWPSLIPAAVRIHTGHGHQLLGYQWIPERSGNKLIKLIFIPKNIIYSQLSARK